MAQVHGMCSEQFAQVHRSVIVNLKQVAQVIRGANETAEVHLRGRSVTLPVSRSFLTPRAMNALHSRSSSSSESRSPFGRNVMFSDMQ